MSKYEPEPHPERESGSEPDLSHEGIDPDLLVEHGDFMRRVAMSLLKDPDLAQDAVQEAVMAFLATPPRGREEGEIRGWLRRVIYNFMLRGIEKQETVARKQERIGADFLSRHLQQCESATSSAARLEQHKIVVERLLALPDIYRETLILKFYDGLSRPEIARKLGIGLEAVKSRLQKGLIQLRLDLDAANEDNRAVWMAALMPLLPMPELLAIVRESNAAATTAEVGAPTLVHSSAKVAGLIAASLLLLGGSAWVGLQFIGSERVDAADEVKVASMPAGSALGRGTELVRDQAPTADIREPTPSSEPGSSIPPGATPPNSEPTTLMGHLYDPTTTRWKTSDATIRFDSSDGWSARATTDPSGAFRFEELHSDQGRLTIEHEFLRGALDWEAEAGSDKSLIRLHVGSRLVIPVRLVTSSGESLEDAMMQAYEVGLPTHLSWKHVSVLATPGQDPPVSFPLDGERPDRFVRDNRISRFVASEQSARGEYRSVVHLLTDSWPITLSAVLGTTPLSHVVLTGPPEGELEMIVDLETVRAKLTALTFRLEDALSRQELLERPSVRLTYLSCRGSGQTLTESLREGSPGWRISDLVPIGGMLEIELAGYEIERIQVDLGRESELGVIALSPLGDFSLTLRSDAGAVTHGTLFLSGKDRNRRRVVPIDASGTTATVIETPEEILTVLYMPQAHQEAADLINADPRWRLVVREYSSTPLGPDVVEVSSEHHLLTLAVGRLTAGMTGKLTIRTAEGEFCDSFDLNGSNANSGWLARYRLFSGRFDLVWAPNSGEPTTRTIDLRSDLEVRVPFD